MATAIYIISTRVHAEKNEYKLGKHTGSKKKLLSRYTTSLINPILYYFRYSKNSERIESILKQHFEKERIVNRNGHKSEWINIKLNLLIDEIDKNFLKYEKNNFDEDIFYEDIFNKGGFTKNSLIKNEINCKKCGKTFNNIYNLNRHLEKSLNCVNGNKSKINYYTCNMCNKMFTRNDSLKKHYDRNRCKKTNIKLNNSMSMNNIDSIRECQSLAQSATTIRECQSLAQSATTLYSAKLRFAL